MPSISIIIALAAMLSIINRKLLRWPSTVGLMFLSILLSLLVILIKPVWPGVYDFFCRVISDADFRSLLMDFMLGLLLFAGAMHVNIRELRDQKWVVLLFATIGVLISTVLVGCLLFLASTLMGVELTIMECLLFGALISPTDPIAVISIMTKLGVNKDLLLKVEGESLFNDGIGVIVFVTLLSFYTDGEAHYELAHLGLTFLEEVGGGLVLGLLFGWIGYLLMRWTRNDIQSNLLITLAITISGYTLASLLHFSGPLSMVVAGLVIGNELRSGKFPESTESGLEMIWEMLDEALNAVLFVLMGLTIQTIVFEWNLFYLGLTAIVIVLISRFVSVALPYMFLKNKDHSKTKTIALLTWGGLRGGISIALVLSLGNVALSEKLLMVTYVVVVFSIIVQGLTIGKLVKLKP